MNIPGSTKFTPNGSSFSISWQSPPVTFTGIPVSEWQKKKKKGKKVFSVFSQCLITVGILTGTEQKQVKLCPSLLAWLIVPSCNSLKCNTVIFVFFFFFCLGDYKQRTELIVCFLKSLLTEGFSGRCRTRHYMLVFLPLRDCLWG